MINLQLISTTLEILDIWLTAAAPTKCKIAFKVRDSDTIKSDTAKFNIR